MRALIVDDSIFTTMLITEILKNINIDSVVKYNGKEAVDYLVVDYNFDFILMDVEMPIMNGIEAMQIIRRFKNKIPVILMTAHNVEDAEKFLNLGFNAYLTKPFETEKLVEILNKLFINI